VRAHAKRDQEAEGEVTKVLLFVCNGRHVLCS
jgi:hypothetical protein